jgi:hypothetical protein
MTTDRDQWADSLSAEHSGGWLSGFLAEEEEFDRRALWRLGSWGAGSIATLIVALYINQSNGTLRRDQIAGVDLARQAQQIQWVAREGQNETRRLASAIDTLNGDRDRLFSRIAVVEQGLDSVTGSIKQNAAASPPPSTSGPTTANPSGSNSSTSSSSTSSSSTSTPSTSASTSSTSNPSTAAPTTSASTTVQPATTDGVTTAPQGQPGAATASNTRPGTPGKNGAVTASATPTTTTATPTTTTTTPPPTAGMPTTATSAPTTPKDGASKDGAGLTQVSTNVPTNAPTTPATIAATGLPERPGAIVAPLPQIPSTPLLLPSVPPPTSAPARPEQAGNITTGPVAALTPPKSMPKSMPKSTPNSTPMSILAPPDAGATKLTEPDKPAPGAPTEEPQKADTAPVSAEPETEEKTETTAVPVPRTQFAVDLGGANSVDGLRALWRGLLKFRTNKALADLQPLIVVRERSNGMGMQLRLVAGPLNDAAAAARICAAMAENKRPCETTLFDGQRLAMVRGDSNSDAARTETSAPPKAVPADHDQPATTARSSHRRGNSKRPATEEVSDKDASKPPAQRSALQFLGLR